MNEQKPPSIRLLTAAKLLGLDPEKGWPETMTERQLATLLSLRDDQEPVKLNAGIGKRLSLLMVLRSAEALTPREVRIAEVKVKTFLRFRKKETWDEGTVNEPYAHVIQHAKPESAEYYYTAADCLKFCQLAQEPPLGPFALEWVESQVPPEETPAQRQDRWLSEFREMGGTVHFEDKIDRQGRKVKGFRTGPRGKLAKMVELLRERGEKGFYDHKEVSEALESAFEREELIIKAKEKTESDMAERQPRGGFSLPRQFFRNS
jgi:hypothetical protein